MKDRTIQSIERDLLQAVLDVLELEPGAVPDVRLTAPPEDVDADFSLACFPMAKAARTSPRAVAERLAAGLAGHPLLSATQAMGPYVNISLHPSHLFGVTLRQVHDEDTGFGRAAATGARILVEYSSPNTNKPLHLGHVRNNTLGLALAEILKAAGNEVITATIFNDRGIHICKAMLAYERFSSGATPVSAGIKGDHFVGGYYVKFEQALREDPGLLDAAQDMLRRWENGDEDVRRLWRTMNGWAMDGMRETYERMGCTFDLVQHESDTYLLGRDIVHEGLARGVFHRKDDGSVWVDLTAAGLDEKVLLRSDGTSVYVTQDLGTAVERFRAYRLDRAIYVVASEQNYHFQVLFSIFALLGYSWSDACHHFNYGMVYLPEGKMKSREGKVVDADDLLDQMKAMARTIMAESGFNFGDHEWDPIAEMVAQGAIKYFMLRVSPKKDIHFDPRESLSFEGATGAYLQYTHARICSIFRKAARNEPLEFDPRRLGEPQETTVVRLLWRYPDTVRRSAEGLNPTRLAYYLWELAKAFNQFYTQHKVLGIEDDSLTTARLALCHSVRVALRNGLSLMGIDAPEKM
ncbi:arginine--tRNA ligase [bacterium]|nr:arginine--tRNA ligase [candidate division CSSED10-310 bacterium]